MYVNLVINNADTPKICKNAVYILYIFKLCEALKFKIIYDIYRWG